MIWNFLISIVLGLLTFVISFLPSADPNIVNAISSQTTAFRNALIAINWFFPVDTALQFLSYIFIIQASIFLFRVIKYIAGALTAGILK